MTKTAIKVLDLKLARELVDKSIEEMGADKVYVKEHGVCKYVHGAEGTWNDDTEDYDIDVDNAVPGCLVGLALFKAGVSLEDMYRSNTDGASDLLSSLEYREVIGKVTDDAEIYLSMLQASQDNGVPWGAANKAAKRGRQMYKVYDDKGAETGEFKEV